MPALTILEKIKETILNFSQRSVTLLQIMTSYQKARTKLTNIKLKN